MFDDGQQVNISPFNEDKFHFQNLIPFEFKYKTKQHKKHKTLASTSALLNREDIHSDDETIYDKRIPTQQELQYIETIKNSTDTPLILNNTDLQLYSLEINAKDNNNLTSILDVDPHKYNDFFVNTKANITNKFLS